MLIVFNVKLVVIRQLKLRVQSVSDLYKSHAVRRVILKMGKATTVSTEKCSSSQEDESLKR